MKKRIGTWFLLKSTWGLFKEKPSMMLLPLIGLLMGVVVIALYFVGIFTLAIHQHHQTWHFLMMSYSSNTVELNQLYNYIFLILAYFVGFTITTFINTAMVAFSMRQLEYGDATVGQALSDAFKRIKIILQWSLLACSIGILLRMLEERFPLMGFIARMIFGVAWALGTYFVLPFIVYENTGPVDALKKSARLFTDTWGNQVKFIIGMGFFEFILIILSLIVCVGGGFILGSIFENHIGIIAASMVVLWFLSLFMLALVSNSVTIIFKNLLFRYATQRSLPASFDRAKLDELLAVKK